MEIINVIEIINGISQIPKSFVIPDNATEAEKDVIVVKAEELFKKLIVENSSKEDKFDEEDFYNFIENGGFENMSGYEVLLNWSEIQK